MPKLYELNQYPPKTNMMTSPFAADTLPGMAESSPIPATSVAFTEGPVVDEHGNVYFSDIENNRILKLAPNGVRTVFREPSGRTNGQTFDQSGRLYHCEGAEFGPGGARRVTRTNLATGQYEVLTDRYEGLRYNSPNDVCVDGYGRVYFTDPRYGDRSDMEMSLEGVYRIDLDGHVHRLLEQPVIHRPNGIAITQDSSTMYVVDSCPVAGGNRKIWRFVLNERGEPREQHCLIDFGRGRGGDGMRLDIDGNLYIAAGISHPRGPHETAEVPPGVHVFSPDGKWLGRIPVYEDVVTNLAFGGEDGRTLYITSGKTLYRVRVAVPGQVAYPKWKNRNTLAHP
jgi:gluconolactonase